MAWPGDHYRTLCAIEVEHGYCTKNGYTAARSAHETLLEIFNFIRVPPIVDPFGDCDIIQDINTAEGVQYNEKKGKKRKVDKEIANKLKKVQKIMDEIKSVPGMISDMDSSSSDDEDEEEVNQLLSSEILQEWSIPESSHANAGSYSPGGNNADHSTKQDDRSIDGDSGFVDDTSSLSDTMSNVDMSLNPVVKLSMPSLTDLLSKPPSSSSSSCSNAKPRKILTTTIEIATDSEEDETPKIDKSKEKRIALRPKLCRRPVLTAVTTQRIALFGHLKSNPTISKEETVRLKEVANSAELDISSSYWCYRKKSDKYRTKWTALEYDIQNPFEQNSLGSSFKMLSEKCIPQVIEKSKSQSEPDPTSNVPLAIEYPKHGKDTHSGGTCLQALMKLRNGFKGIQLRSLTLKQ